MNTTVATLSADLVLRQEQFERALSQVHGQLSTLNNTLRVITGAVAGVFAFDRLKGGMESVVGAAIDLESRLSQVRKTTGLTGSELGALRTQLEGLASTVGGLKFEELLNLAAVGGRLGIAGDKVGDFARDIGLIRIALEDISAEEAATSIGRILNVFHLGTDQAINFASALNKLDDSSSATGRDILEITQRLSGSAAVLGLSPQKVLALSASLKDAGVENEVAGTAISQLFSKMATDGAKFAEVSGVSFGRFASVLRADPLAALLLFEKGLSRLDGVAQLQTLDALELDGARVKATLSQLNSVVDRVPGYVRMANTEWKTLGSILKEVDVAGNTTQAQLDRVKNVLQITAATIGEFTLPVVKALANSFGDLAQDVQRFFRANEAAVAGFADKVRLGAGYVGLFFREFKTLAQVGLLLGAEKFEQFVEVTRRVGVMAGANLAAGFTNAVVVIENTFRALGPFLGDLFKQVGANLGANLTNALNEAIGTWSGNAVSRKFAEVIDKLMPGTLKAFDDIARAAVPRVPVPAIAPDTSGLNRANVFRGVAPLPGFGNPFAGLPDRGAEINPLLGQLDQARAAMNRDLDARRGAAMPRPKPVPVNPFLGKPRAALGRDRESAAKRERAALKDARDARDRAGRAARGGPGVPRRRERAAAFTRSPLGRASAAAGAALGGPGLGGLDVSALFSGSQQGAAAAAQARAARAREELNQIAEAQAAMPARRRRGVAPPLAPAADTEPPPEPRPRAPLSPEQQRRADEAQRLIEKADADREARQAAVRQVIDRPAADDGGRAARARAMIDARAEDDRRRNEAADRDRKGLPPQPPADFGGPSNERMRTPQAQTGPTGLQSAMASTAMGAMPQPAADLGALMQGFNAVNAASLQRDQAAQRAAGSMNQTMAALAAAHNQQGGGWDQITAAAVQIRSAIKSPGR